MNNELLQNDVKNALVVCLRKKFPNAKFYKDGYITAYPCFYVSFINIFTQPISLIKPDTYRIKFFIRIEYREDEQPSRINNLNTILDNVGMILLECLRKINIYEKEYLMDITNNETVDNVRIFECNFSMIIDYYEEKEEVVMESLDQNLKLFDK